MSDKTGNNGTGSKKPLTLKRSGKLELKQSVDSGEVRQNFSHGRSRSVAVEVRRKRGAKRPGISGEIETAFTKNDTQKDSRKSGIEKSKSISRDESNKDKKSRFVLRTLTDDEKAARARAVEDAEKAELEAREKAEKDAFLVAEADANRKKEQDEAEQRASQESERRKSEEKDREVAEEKAAKRLTTKKKEKTLEVPEIIPSIEDLGDDQSGRREDNRGVKKTKNQELKKAPSSRRDRNQSRRRSGRLTVIEALEDGERGERGRSLAALKRQRERERREAKENLEPNKPIVREVVIPESISVQELANRMAIRGAEVVKTLFNMGMSATITQSIDADTAELLVAEFGHKVKRVSESDVEIGLQGEEDDKDALVLRPSVVTVMGHVDHGKTSLLDALRSSDIAGVEAGGITQHIGAYQISRESGAKITFVDTPGHAAFTQMRARGAKVTDIVVLVVAADDGIMPQTIEAINHARAADAPIIVAINKMDLPDANADKVRNEMLQYELVTEELGGDILSVEVSAKENRNLDKLCEAILLQAEILELRANPDRSAEGVVLEAKVDQGRGIVATLLVQRGTLRIGDIVVAGASWGRVKAIFDDRGQRFEEVLPSMPCEILGLSGAPEAGDEFVVVENDRRAREVTEFRETREHAARVNRVTSPLSIEQMFIENDKEKLREMPLVIKADVHGSVEAIVGAVSNLSTDEVASKVIHAGVGGVIESDVTLAKASGASIIGFNVRANSQAKDFADREKILIRYYSVIYDVVDDVKSQLGGLLKPTLKEKILGNAEVQKIFNVGKKGRVAGCRVTNGIVKRGAKVRLLRDNVVIHDGELKTLRRFKDEVREVKEGYECGIAFENYDEIREGDVLEFYEIEEIARKLD